MLNDLYIPMILFKTLCTLTETIAKSFLGKIGPCNQLIHEWTWSWLYWVQRLYWYYQVSHGLWPWLSLSPIYQYTLLLVKCSHSLLCRQMPFMHLRNLFTIGPRFLVPTRKRDTVSQHLWLSLPGSPLSAPTTIQSACLRGGPIPWKHPMYVINELISCFHKGADFVSWITFWVLLLWWRILVEKVWMQVLWMSRPTSKRWAEIQVWRILLDI